MDKYKWSDWYCNLSHLTVPRGGSKDIATIRLFPNGSCELWVYNTAQEDIFTNTESTTDHKDANTAMATAEKRFGVKGERPGPVKYLEYKPYRPSSNAFN